MYTSFFVNQFGRNKCVEGQEHYEYDGILKELKLVSKSELSSFYSGHY
jgi:hypothetical protein